MENKILLLLLTISILFFSSCNPERNKTYCKEITTNDVLVEACSSDTSFKFVVRPQIDVDDLNISIGFCDENSFPVSARIKNVGKVIAGNEYYIEFLNSDFTSKEIHSISKWRYLDAEGTVYVEQDAKGMCSKHVYDDGVVNKKNTCYAAGEKIFSCKYCGYKKSEVIAMKEHEWVDNKYSDMKYICNKCCVRSDQK